MQAMFPINPAEDITALVLAGGQARRLGGRDKGLIPLAGKPLISHVLDKLSPQLDSVMINANRHHKAYRQFSRPVIADSLPGFAGPLAGLLSGLQKMTTEWLLGVPCDNPYLTENLVQRFTDTANAKQCLLTVASCQGQLQPVYCLLHRSLTDSLSGYLAAGQYKARDWIQQQAHCLVEFDDPHAFENINTPHQLAKAEKNI